MTKILCWFQLTSNTIYMRTSKFAKIVELGGDTQILLTLHKDAKSEYYNLVIKSCCYDTVMAKTLSFRTKQEAIEYMDAYNNYDAHYDWFELMSQGL